MKTMKDELWGFGKRTESLQTFLTEIRGVWRDEAAREVHTKFLVPQKDHAENAQSKFGNQEEALHQASTLCSNAGEKTRELERLHQAVEKAMQATEQEMKEAHQHRENALGVRDEARTLCEQVKQTIDKANNACS